MRYKETKKDKNDLIRAMRTIESEANGTLGFPSILRYHEIDLPMTMIQLPIWINNIINSMDVENTVECLSYLTQQKTFALVDIFLDLTFINSLAKIISSNNYPTVSVHLIILLHNLWYYSNTETLNVFNPQLIIAFTTFYSYEHPITLSYAYHATIILINRSYDFIPILIENGLVESLLHFISNRENDKDSYLSVHIISYIYEYLGENAQILDSLIPYLTRFIVSKYVQLRNVSTLCLYYAMKSERSFHISMEVPDFLEIIQNAQLLGLLPQADSLYQCYCILFEHGIHDIFGDTFFSEMLKSVKKSFESMLVPSIYMFIRETMPNNIR